MFRRPAQRGDRFPGSERLGGDEARKETVLFEGYDQDTCPPITTLNSPVAPIRYRLGRFTMVTRAALYERLARSDPAAAKAQSVASTAARAESGNGTAARHRVPFLMYSSP